MLLIHTTVLAVLFSILPNFSYSTELENAETPIQYHFDCRPLMLFHNDKAAIVGDKILEVITFASFYKVIMNNNVNNVKLFHLVNYIQARAGQGLRKPKDFAGGKPLFIIGSRQQKKNDQFVENLDEYGKNYLKFADKIGKELTLEFYNEFRKFRSFTDEDIDHYLYMALFKLNFSYGPDSFCDFAAEPGRQAYKDIEHAKYSVVNYKSAKEMLLNEALRIAKEDIASGKIISMENPPPPSNPFNDGRKSTGMASDSSWTWWFEQYGPKEPTPGYYGSYRR